VQNKNVFNALRRNLSCDNFNLNYQDFSIIK